MNSSLATLVKILRKCSSSLKSVCLPWPVAVLETICLLIKTSSIESQLERLNSIFACLEIRKRFHYPRSPLKSRLWQHRSALLVDESTLHFALLLAHSRQLSVSLCLFCSPETTSLTKIGSQKFPCQACRVWSHFPVHEAIFVALVIF